MSTNLVSTSELQTWVEQLFLVAGSSSVEAQRVADHLIAANLSGHDSHGIGMVPRYVKSLLNDELRLNQTIDLVVDHDTMIVADGQQGLGQSVAWQAMEVAIERAQSHGLALMGLRNAHHIGRVGHWAELAVKQDLISIHFTNASSEGPIVAPFGGAEARFITNPFTVGIPRGDDDAIVLDFATSAIAHGKARVAYNKKVDVPANSVIDSEGNETRDPKVLFEEPMGALQTFAAHKGYALAMVCELLGAALTGGRTMRPDNFSKQFGIWNNMLTIVIDPSRLNDINSFQSEAKAFVEWVQSAALSAPGKALGSILIPGDPERRMRKERAQHIPIDDTTLAQLDEAAKAISAARDGQIGALSPLSKVG